MLTNRATDPRIAQPAKCLASSSVQVKASDEKLPTIVTPIITALTTRQLDEAREQVPPSEGLTPLEKAAPGRGITAEHEGPTCQC